MPKTLTSSIYRWLDFTKKELHEQKLQKLLEIPNFQFASLLKIQVDSLLQQV